MRKRHKKLQKRHKKVIEMIENKHDLYDVYYHFKIDENVIKIWRQTILGFDDLYLKAIGLTRLQEHFINLFPLRFLNVAATCREVRISRQTFYRWLEESDTFRAFHRDIVEGFKDDIETILLKKIFIDENVMAMKIYSEAKMKDRGYGVSTHIVTNEKRNIKIPTKDYSKYTMQELDAEIALFEAKLN